MKLWDEIRSIESGKKDLRKFGLTLGVFFGLLAAWFFWRHRGFAPALAGVSIFFLAFALALPAFLKPVQKVWMGLALVMGWLMTRVILTVFFYGILTPISLAARLAGQDPLGLKSARGRPSFWSERKGWNDPKRYEYQY